MSQFSFFEAPTRSGPLSVLTVCTGNICRSPLAELLLTHTLQGLPVRVQSAGTTPLIGHPMTEQNRAIAKEYGVTNADSHAARELTPGLIRDADLVLALSREHRRAVVEMLPKASRHTFTLREFARLAEVADLEELTLPRTANVDDRLRETVDLIAQVRGSLPPLTNLEDHDVIDPYRQSDEVYQASAQQIIPAVNTVTALFRRAAGGAV